MTEANPGHEISRHVTTRTVDGDGDALGEDITIGADEGWDLAQRVRLQEFLRRLLGIDLDLLELEVVGLRNGTDSRGAGVALGERV